MVQVLIIEDDDRIRPLLMRSLRPARVRRRLRGHRHGRGCSAPIETRPDLVILDLGLPDVDGTQVLSMLRAVSEVPVIVASARDDDPSLVGCLDAGADDYVVKPYTTAQLEARIRAVLRRTARRAHAAAEPRRRRAGARRRCPPDDPGRRAGRAEPARVRPAAPPGRARRRGGDQEGAAQPRSGSRPGAARTRPSTCTCRGCAASSARPRPSPATCTPVRGVGVRLAAPGGPDPCAAA